MAPRKSVDLTKLEALGAARLAEILLEVAADDAGIKRRLRLELRAESGAEAVAAEIGKRLATLRQAKSFIEWEKRTTFLKDLDLQRQMIVEKVAPGRPDLALDLLWRFMALAGPVLERVEGGGGEVADVFRQAGRDLATVAAAASPEPIALADRVLEAVTTDGYGEHDELVRLILPTLGETGIARLKARLTEELARRPKPKREGGFDYRAHRLHRAMQDIADHQGDVDTFIAHETHRRVPARAAAIATRLLAAGRAEEALGYLREAAPEEHAEDLDDERLYAWEGAAAADWDEAWVAALRATGRADEAQRFRWARFEQRLDAGHLRAYLKALPDFEDVVAERKALDYALAFARFATALRFLAEWPDPHRAARLVQERHGEIDGNLYYVLDPAAKALESKQPLAAALLRRAMIEDTLDGAKSKRYRHAVRHLLECRALEPDIQDHGGFETHDAFEARLRARHGRKAAFWSLLAEHDRPAGSR